MFPMALLKDGAIGKFRIMNLTKTVSDDGITRWQVTLMHDMFAFPDDQYETDNDPVLSLQLNAAAYVDKDGTALIEPPQDDPEFVEWERFPLVLESAGYADDSNNRFPLNVDVYAEVGLSGKKNYIRRIGGAELLPQTQRTMEMMDEMIESAR